jgi:uracil DNA glycosylase
MVRASTWSLFSVQNGSSSILLNIFKELGVGRVKRTAISQKWANRGVFLLNAQLCAPATA